MENRNEWYLSQCSNTGQAEIAVLPARTRGLSQLGGIVGSFLRCVWLSVVNLN